MVEKVMFEYAAAFEETYEDDDWSRLEKYFADDAVYEVAGAPFACALEGPATILRGMKKSLDGFDRRFVSRKLDVLGEPSIEGDAVDIDWCVTYEWAGAPPLLLKGHTHCVVENGVITRLVDSYGDEDMRSSGEWLAKYTPDLDPSYT